MWIDSTSGWEDNDMESRIDFLLTELEVSERKMSLR
eukprot:COSAG01_NODE_919_length_12738_cov_5.862964_11_plen_36_part_01